MSDINDIPLTALYQKMDAEAHNTGQNFDAIIFARAAIAADRARRQDELSFTVDGVVMNALEYIDFLHDQRASRQVANKAEVEPVAYLKFWARQSWSGNGNHDVEHAEGLEVCEAGEIGDDGAPAFPVYATPPATTGASTALTDERKRAMFEEWATKQGGYDLRPYNWRLKSIGGVPYTGYVRPYKQDRTVYAFEGFVAALGEVAAQAGQVAVPETCTLPPEGWYCTRPAGHEGPCAAWPCDQKFEYLAAPSPAKESK